MTEPIIALEGVEKAYRFFKLTDVSLRLDAGAPRSSARC